jgi:hypothetical protein
VKTNAFRNAIGLPWFFRLLVPVLRSMVMSPRAAAETPVFLAQSDDAIDAGGRFYGPRRKERRVPERARRPERRKMLWEASDALVGAYLRPPSHATQSREVELGCRIAAV